MNRWDKKEFARSIAVYLVSWDVLICSSNEIMSGTLGCNWSHHLEKFTIINCHSPKSIYLLHRTNMRLEWGCGVITIPVYFKSLMVALISRDAVLLLAFYCPNVKCPKVLMASSWFSPACSTSF